MAETTPLDVIANTQAAGMVSGGVGEVERSSTVPRAQSSRLGAQVSTLSAVVYPYGCQERLNYGW